MNKRVYNFSSGPAILPESVLEKAKNEMLNYQNSGMSVMEMSHRSKVYEEIIYGTEKLLRELMNIPSNYKVLFLQGGASTQFAAIPLNIGNKSGIADIIGTGMWTNKAESEARKYCKVNVVASSKDKMFSYIPEVKKEDFSPDADYVHICWNNTIYGTKYTSVPDVGNVPLVVDMSSCILSEKVDVSKFGIIFAGAQKNIGPAGLTVVIVREDLIGIHRESTPTMLTYEIHAKNDSLYNTPPTYSIYICKLVLEWLKELGGVEKIQEINERKANAFYDFLDSSKLFNSTVNPKDRSIMNIPFVTGNEEIDKKFIAAATDAGFVNLKGHRSVGGMRASIYNAMPEQGVLELIEFMKKFENK
ncbi:MAG: 3-phosphoserine/phosphohydroxythreonine transaminase [Ruminococcaceae bacterium]|nr:3-phosphoserine/phosphohydroxythreonine transaminase [Oscillospiraceae bacterium]